jgi:hypothetical protein
MSLQNCATIQIHACSAACIAALQHWQLLLLSADTDTMQLLFLVANKFPRRHLMLHHGSGFDESEKHGAICYCVWNNLEVHR